MSNAKFTFTLCREVTEFVEITVEAESLEAAHRKALSNPPILNWAPCDPQEPAVYLPDPDSYTTESISIDTAQQEGDQRMSQYSHAYAFGFELESNKRTGEDVTVTQLRAAIIEYLARISDAELLDNCGWPFDTHEIEAEEEAGEANHFSPSRGGPRRSIMLHT